MINKLLLSLAALAVSGAALAVQPEAGDSDMSPMAEDWCARDSSMCTGGGGSPPPKRPRQ